MKTLNKKLKNVWGEYRDDLKYLAITAIPSAVFIYIIYKYGDFSKLF